MLLLSLTAVLAAAAALVQLAVLRDRTIAELDFVEVMRRLRIAGWAIVAIHSASAAALGWWVPPATQVALLLLALADTLAAAARLLPTDRMMSRGRR